MSYSSSYYRGSPNHGASNLMIGVTVLICLWNVWITPATLEMEMPTTSAASPNEKSLTNQEIAIYDASSRQHILPIQSMDGHPVVLLTSQMIASSIQSDAHQMTTPTEQDEIPNEKGPDDSLKLQKPTRRSKVKPKKRIVPKSFGSTTNIRTKYRRHYLEPTIHATAKSPSRSKFYQSKTTIPITSTTQQQSTFFLVALSISIVMGAIFARKALEKLQKWEEQSNQDSLAYDMAYTDTISETGYGSFVSTWSGDLDKFDV